MLTMATPYNRRSVAIPYEEEWIRHIMFTWRTNKSRETVPTLFSL